jgi:nucleotide-binding universal stress UspA family protein
MMRPMRVCVWVVEGSWQACVDAAAAAIPPDAGVVLLHVTPADVEEAFEAAAAARIGRSLGGRKATHRVEASAGEAASELLAAAAERLGREGTELLARRGRVEREVIRAVAEGVDLLVVARDGDRSRLGPRSLGPATRFVVDHAPCAVLLVWPDAPPGIESIPPAPRHHPPPA